MTNILYPELSYQIVGIAYKVYNTLGFGHQEKYYQKAFEQELNMSATPYERERYVQVEYSGVPIGKYFLDFIIRDKVIVELKVGNVSWRVPIKQVLGYLRTVNAQLAIIIVFTQSGVLYKRIINPDYQQK